MSRQRAISRQSLPEVIAKDLRERILSGELSEGEVIRQEALADDYDVSRMPVREALKQLDAEGLVQLTNNKGARVTRHSIEEIREIFDLRILLEVDLFRRSIPSLTAAHFAECQKILEKMDRSYDAEETAEWGKLNHAFHSALYAAADRAMTHDILRNIGLHSDRYVRMHLSVMARRAPAKEEHHQLLHLAREGNTDAACDLLRQHIGRSRDQLLDMIVAARALETSA
ncbi:MAG: GntR family transcriptional regulator [Pelagimonas sp.]|jgi:DNA-binding GntR family transcriptional regulator|nr:GntR family transcriptional regulator [Pelagimonas sp.]